MQQCCYMLLWKEIMSPCWTPDFGMLMAARHLAKVGVGPAQQSRDDGKDSKTNCVALLKEPLADWQAASRNKKAQKLQDPIRKASGDHIVLFRFINWKHVPMFLACPVPIEALRGRCRSSWEFGVQPDSTWEREKKATSKKRLRKKLSG